MKAQPLIRNPNGPGYLECRPSQATHLRLRLPGPLPDRVLPVMIGGTRDGTNCWTWNGDIREPTLAPSIKTTGISPIDNREYVCHTWVQRGMAFFHHDTTHELNGKTLDLLDVIPQVDRGNSRWPGFFIVLEGIDGTGKSTQTGMLVNKLRSHGHIVTQSLEPTHGEWGRKIRESYKSGRMPFYKELDAFVKDREQHIELIIKPALLEGQIVVLDRYYYSSVAYQGAVCDDPDYIERVMSFVLKPDIVFLLDISPEISQERLKIRAEDSNYFESLANLEKCRDIYLRLASRNPEFCIIHAVERPAKVHAEISYRAIEALGKLGE